MSTTTEINLETLLKWSPPKRVNTGFGPRILRTASKTDEFSALWTSNKLQLKDAGIGWTKDTKTGEWIVCWWQPLDKSEAEAQAKAIEASKATDANVAIPAPEGLNYLGYQRAGISFAMGAYSRGIDGVLIGDEMGLGKTIQGIGIINSDPKIHRVLIICPATLKINWYRELRKWLVRNQSIGIAHSKSFPKTDIVIINYDIVHKFEAATNFYWDLIICDEVHLLKNPKTIRSKAILGYRPTKKEQKEGVEPKSAIPTRRKCGLTGTPICNRPKELFPILSWLDPKNWGNFFQFAKRYCGGVETMHGWNFDGATNLPELQTKLRSTVMVRRLKKDVLKELPPKRRQIIELPADGLEDLIKSEATVFARWEGKLIELKSRVEMAKVTDDAAGYAEAVKKLQEGASAAFAEGANAAHDIAIKKVPMIVAHIRECLEESGKIILFCHHLDVISAYMKEFKAEGAVRIDGTLTLQERQKSVDAFQNDPDVKIIVAGIKAAGVGITLTASSHEIFAELDWVPANMLQCEDRAHRIGQINTVLVQHMVLEGSLDARKAATLVAKMAIADSALDKAVAMEAPKDRITTLTVTESDEVVLPTGGVSITQKEAQEQAAKLTPEQVRAIHRGLQTLAGSCDGARNIDDKGFNKFDATIGKALAFSPALTPKMAALGRKLVNKYRGQLDLPLLEAAGIKVKGANASA